MRTIIAGSRTLPRRLKQEDEYRAPEYDPADIDWMMEMIDWVDDDGEITQVISGGAKGADAIGEVWAYDNDMQPLVFLADWDKHGKSAGFKRNIRNGPGSRYAHCILGRQIEGHETYDRDRPDVWS